MLLLLREKFFFEFVISVEIGPIAQFKLSFFLSHFQTTLRSTKSLTTTPTSFAEMDAYKKVFLEKPAVWQDILDLAS